MVEGIIGFSDDAEYSTNNWNSRNNGIDTDFLKKATQSLSTHQKLEFSMT